MKDNSASRATIEPKRDVRIDRIGFVNELVKYFADPLKEKVKADHPGKALLTADYFDAIITTPNETHIPLEKWFALFDAGTIDRKQFMEGLKVSTTVAGKVLDEKTFKRVSKTAPGSRQLRITRKKGVEVKLVDAVRHLDFEITEASKLTLAAAA
jgi:hypothetical protein